MLDQGEVKRGIMHTCPWAVALCNGFEDASPLRISKLNCQHRSTCLMSIWVLKHRLAMYN